MPTPSAATMVKRSVTDMSAVFKTALWVSWGSLSASCFHAFADHFFFSAFQMVRETARPQNGQKLMG